MERNQDVELVELGTVSADTRGVVIGFPAEDDGFYPLGLTDE